MVLHHISFEKRRTATRILSAWPRCSNLRPVHTAPQTLPTYPNRLLLSILADTVQAGIAYDPSEWTGDPQQQLIVQCPYPPIVWNVSRDLLWTIKLAALVGFDGGLEKGLNIPYTNALVKACTNASAMKTKTEDKIHETTHMSPQTYYRQSCA